MFIKPLSSDSDPLAPNHGLLARMMYTLFHQITTIIRNIDKQPGFRISEFKDPRWCQLIISVRSFYGLSYIYHLECQSLVNCGSDYELSSFCNTKTLQQFHSPCTMLSSWGGNVPSINLMGQMCRATLITISSQKCLLVCHPLSCENASQRDCYKWNCGLTRSEDWELREIFTPNCLSSLVSHMDESNCYVAFYLRYSTSHDFCYGELCLAWYEIDVLLQGAFKLIPICPSHCRAIRLNQPPDITNWRDFRLLCQSLHACNIVVEQGYVHALMVDPGRFLFSELKSPLATYGDSRLNWFILRVPLTQPRNRLAHSSPLIPECFGPLFLSPNEMQRSITISPRSDLLTVYEYCRNSDLYCHQVNTGPLADSKVPYKTRVRVSVRHLLGLFDDEVLLWMRCLANERYDDVILCHRFSNQCIPVVSILRFPLDQICGANLSVYPICLFPVRLGSIDFSPIIHSLPDTTAEHALFWGLEYSELDFCKLNIVSLIRLLDKTTSDVITASRSNGNSKVQILLDLFDTAGTNLGLQANESTDTKPVSGQKCTIACLPVTRVPEHFYIKLCNQHQQLARQSTDPRYSAAQRELYRAIASRISTWSTKITTKSTPLDLSDSGCFCGDSVKLPGFQKQFSETDDPSKSLLPAIPRVIATCILRFGSYGTAFHELREPNGIAILPDSTIAVADGNAEMIKFFSPNGQFIKAWKLRTTCSVSAFPNCLAVRPAVIARQLSSSHSPFTHAWPESNTTESPSPGELLMNSTVTDLSDREGSEEMGDLVVVLRKPAPSVQVYSTHGKKIREFQGGLISPKCVAIDRDDRIVVVESHIMRVNVYTWMGQLLIRFQTRLAYPVSVAVDSAYCIYITDNLAHCVVVFNYAGDVLGTIGSRGLTNYPFGVTILNSDWVSTAEENSSEQPPGMVRPSRVERVVVVDNHNNLNISIFDPSGRLVHAMQSKIKHAQIYAIALDYRTGTDSIFGITKPPSRTTNRGYQSEAGGAKLNCTSRLSLVVASKDFRIYRYPLSYDILKY